MTYKCDDWGKSTDNSTEFDIGKKHLKYLSVLDNDS